MSPHQQTRHTANTQPRPTDECLDFSAARRAKADREPPQNLEAERGVLGSCLLDNDQIDEAALWVSEADFYRASHAEIFAAILAIRDEGKPVDAVTLADHLIHRGRFETLGGDETIREILEATPHAKNAVYYAKIVRERSLARQLLEASLGTIDEIYSNLYTGPELVDRVEQKVFAITDQVSSGATISAEELAKETWLRLQRLKDNRSVGLATGYHDLDELIGGFSPGQLIILAARPAVGKTALGLNIAAKIASFGQGVLFASLEMGRSELGNRLVSSFGCIDGNSLATPWFLTDVAWTEVLSACERVSGFPLWIDDTPARTAPQIEANARRLKHRSPQGLSLVVIDYLSLINGQKAKGESRQEEVARVSRRLKQMARNLKIPVLCLHQLNRGIEHRDDRKPRMADLRESGQIEQDADVVLLLYRPDQVKADDRPGEADLIVAKNRNGATGDVRLVFAKHLTRFDSFAPDPIESADNSNPF